MATKKNSSSPGTTRSRSKKTVETTNESSTSTPETPVSGTSGGTAVAPAREKITTTTQPANNRPNFNYPADVQARIRQRAYELFQQRGGQHGFDVQDWLRAEAEMTRR